MSPSGSAPAVARGGSVTWACTPGFPPVCIFPFTPPEHYGVANLHEFQALMYRPLYWYGSRGVPAVDDELSLADPPIWSEDGRTATIRVRPYRWSNGETVDADGVLIWMRLLNARKHRFGGYAPGCFPDNLLRCDKVAHDRVSFTFDRAYAPSWVLMNQLSTITPLPQAWNRTAVGGSEDPDPVDVYDFLMSENDNRAGWPRSSVWSVVNGPWRLASYDIDGSTGTATLVPNDHYSGPRRPRLDELRLQATATDEEEYALLHSGAVQVGYLPFEKVTAPTTDPCRGGPNPLGDRYRLVPQLTYKIHYAPLNFDNRTTAGALLRQLYLRQALQSVLDQDGAIETIYRGYGYPTYGPIPVLPDTPLLSPAQHQNPYPFDIARARRLLSDHGWAVNTTPAVCVRSGPAPGHSGEGVAAGDLLRLTMRYAAGHESLRQLLHRFQHDAAAAGIEIELVEVDAAVLVREEHTEPTEDCARGRWQLSSWNGGWAYAPAYHPTGESLFGSGSPVNFGQYCDPVADELIERTLLSDAVSDLHAYQDYMAAQVPVLWMPNFPLRLLEIRHDLQGLEPINPFGLITPEDWFFGLSEERDVV